MANFGSLWIGNPLSKVEQTAISSFIHYQHSFTLFVYDLDIEVPSGVIKEDARKILPESKIFKIDNSFAVFSDIFRYKMIKETGLIWSDTDSIWFTSEWNLGKYIFGYEDELNTVAIGILKMPQDSELIDFLNNSANNYDRSKIVWAEIGPKLLTEGVEKFNLSHHVKERKTFYPVHYNQWRSLWDPNKLDWVIDQCKDSYSLQIWNQFLNRNNVNKNELPKGSAIKYYYDKFKIK